MASKTPNAPPDNIFALDLTLYQTFLVDLPPRATLGMRTEQPGWEAARAEVVANQPNYGDRAGITATDFGRFVALNDQYGQILVQLPRVAKAVEVLNESASYLDDQRHKLVTQFANAAEKHAKMEGNDPTLLTAYEKTIAYRGVIAAKAAKTKQKNEEAKKAGGAEPPAAPADPAAPATAAEPGKASGAVAKAPNAPPDSIFAIDLNPLKAFLVDLPPLATRGMRTAHEGWEGVVEEIVANQPKYGDRAGITATDFNRFVALNDQHAQVVPVIPVAEKAQEVLEESLSHVDHQRHMLLSQFATSAEAHAAAEGGDPTLKTAYEKAIAYRGVSAAKAAKTKQKNEEAKKATPGPTG